LRVTHCPARGVLDSGVLGRNIGSTSIRDLIAARRPRAHIHGHCHAAFGREGRHFNVASARQKRAMIIDLDTLQHRVVTT
jgi:Icc-related predicted phosphoesterase